MDEIDIQETSNEIAEDIFGKKEESEETIEETTEVNTEVSEEVSEEEIEALTAPDSWKKEYKEKFTSLDRDMQEYMILREQQMAEGAEYTNDDTKFGMALKEITNPYKELFEAQGVDAQTAIQYLLNAHHKMSTADEQGKIDILNQIGKSYGINQDGKPTPEIDQLQQRINQLEGMVTQSQQLTQQEREAKAMEEVNAFASNNEYFDDVAEDVVTYINAGYSLQDAYEKAKWSNPEVRQKLIEKENQERLDQIEKEKQEQIEKARKAKSTNVKTLDTNKAPTGPTGKMFDDLGDRYDEIVSRSN